MNIIPSQYQEMETVFECINKFQARCITFISPIGGTGTTTSAVSAANRLANGQAKVLLIDLNSCNPMTESDLRDVAAQKDEWSFADISCQLAPQHVEKFDFLSITNLLDLALVREKSVFEKAVLMLKQEYDYILFDMSPLNKNNQSNFPLHLLMSVTDVLFMTVSLGKTTQEELDKAVSLIKETSCEQVFVLVSQTQMPPLGVCLINSLNKKLTKLPKLKNRLIRFIERQQWLFEGV